MHLDEFFETCLLCGSSRIHPLVSYEKDYLVSCDQCQFVFCKKKPSTYELKKHYESYKRAMPISEITIVRYNALLDSFERYRKTNNIIDVGCGDGHFLALAKSRNWNVFGTEFTQTAIDVCLQKGIQMTEGRLDENQYGEGFFDIITSFEVIEHINTPIGEVTAFHKLLRKGGIAYVTTPNFDSVSKLLLGPKWNVIQYPEHLCYYTRETLTSLFAGHQFAVIKLTTSGFSINRLKASRSKTTPGDSIDADEEIRRKAEYVTIFKWVKNFINTALNMLNKGDAMKALFQKI